MKRSHLVARLASISQSLFFCFAMLFAAYLGLDTADGVDFFTKHDPLVLAALNATSANLSNDVIAPTNSALLDSCFHDLRKIADRTEILA